MSYIENHLLADEEIFYSANLHWIVFLTPIVLTIAIIFISRLNVEMEMINYGAFMIAGAFWVSAYVKYLTSEFAVTNKRVLMKVGFIRINSLEILLQRIESIQVDQTILGRILGYGSVIVSGTGGSRDVFGMISDPLEFRKKVQEQLEKVL